MAIHEVKYPRTCPSSSNDEISAPRNKMLSQYNIIKRSFTKIVQIMPLGFSIIGSTVTFDLFFRWATQGPLGPLVCYADKASWGLHKCVKTTAKKMNESPVCPSIRTQDLRHRSPVCLPLGHRDKKMLTSIVRLFNCFIIIPGNINKQKPNLWTTLNHQSLSPQIFKHVWLLYLGVSHIYRSGICCLIMLKMYHLH